MKRKCPICNAPLSHNCYVKDNGTATLSYLELIIKDDNLKKINYELKAVIVQIVDMLSSMLIYKTSQKKP